MVKTMQPINKQCCHFCVAGGLISKLNGQILKLPILTIDPNTNNILDKIELFCKGQTALKLQKLNFKKGDYGYCEGNVTFSKDRPSDIDPIELQKLDPGTLKFKNLDFDETNNVLYTYIKGHRVDYDDKGNKVNWAKDLSNNELKNSNFANDKLSWTKKSVEQNTVQTKNEKNYQERKKLIKLFNFDDDQETM